MESRERKVVVRQPTDGGDNILIELSGVDSDDRPSLSSDSLQDYWHEPKEVSDLPKTNAFEEGVKLIRNCADQLYRESRMSPAVAQSKLEVEFGVVFTSEGYAALSAKREQGQIQVRLTWPN